MSKLLWDAFTDSLSYEFTGLCRVTDTGFARDATVTCLDVSGVTAAVPQRAKALLEAKAAAAEDKTEIYNEDNSYRNELVDQALDGAVTQALSEDAQTVTRDVTLGLIYQDGAWWVVPDQCAADNHLRRGVRRTDMAYQPKFARKNHRVSPFSSCWGSSWCRFLWL